jgi:hypothetical protein
MSAAKEEGEKQVTTRIPGHEHADSLTGARSQEPTTASMQGRDPDRTSSRQPDRGLPPALTDAADATDATDGADTADRADAAPAADRTRGKAPVKGTGRTGRAGRAGRARKAQSVSPWQRSHSVWHRAGVDWTSGAATRAGGAVEDALRPADTAGSDGSDASNGSNGSNGSERVVASPADDTTDTHGTTDSEDTAAAQRRPPTRRSSPVRRHAGRIGAVVTGVLVVGAGIYAVQDGEKEPVQAPRQAVAVDASRLFAPDPAATADGRSQVLGAVAADGDTVVAIGSDENRGRFLASSDAGVSWRVGTVRAADGDEPPPGEFPRLVAGGVRAWVALGGPAGGGQLGRTSAVDVLWTSLDGRTWTRRAGSPAFRSGDRVSALVRTASGFAAAGAASGAPAVWLSRDGRTWQRASARPAGAVRLERLAAVGDTLVAQGTRRSTVVQTVLKGKTRQNVRKTVVAEGHWRSADGGRSWSPVSVPQGLGSYGASDGLAGGSRRFFLTREARRVTGVGQKRKRVRYGVVFSSADGLRWSAAGRLSGPDYLRVERLSGTTAGIAVLVRVSGRKTAVLRSADGRTWRRAGDITGAEARDLAVLPSTTVVAGRRGDDAYLSVPGSGDVDLAKVAGAVQPERSVAGLASAAGRAVVVGSTNGDAAVWSSGDGRSWRRATGEGFGGAGAQRLTTVLRGAREWAAIGRSGDKPLVMTSADGLTWRRAAALPAAFRPGRAAYGPAGYVVVGRSRSAAAVWHSADLTTWTRGSGALGTTREMTDVTAVRRGYVAVGAAIGRDKGRAPMVWTSADGKDWKAAGTVPVPAGARPGGLTRVASHGDTLVALAPSFVSVSADGGRTWRSQPLAGAATVASTPKGFVLTGTDGASGRADVLLWTSADGRAWRSIRPHGTGLDGPGAQRLTALTTLGDRLLAVGVMTGDRGETPTLWLTPRP